jgi:hypothetical protein
MGASYGPFTDPLFADQVPAPDVPYIAPREVPSADVPSVISPRLMLLLLKCLDEQT